MSEMLNIVVGKLESKPVLTPAFKSRFMVKNYLITEGDEGEDHDARVPIVAWDDVAEEMMQYNKDDKIYLLCIPNDSMIQMEGKLISVLGFKVLKIDHDRKISLKVNKKIMEILNLSQ